MVVSSSRVIHEYVDNVRRLTYRPPRTNHLGGLFLATYKKSKIRLKTVTMHRMIYLFDQIDLMDNGKL